MAAHYDIKGVRRGNTFSRVFRLLDGEESPLDLDGSTLVFSVETAAGSVLRKSTAVIDSGFEISSGNEATLTLTPEETRTLRVGRTTRYELERLIGTTETTILEGCMTVSEGINADA